VAKDLSPRPVQILTPLQQLTPRPPNPKDRYLTILLLPGSPSVLTYFHIIIMSNFL
jgi:hypothetical protein